MNNELHNFDMNEINRTHVEGYKNIKPQGEMSIKEVTDFWTAEFKSIRNEFKEIGKDTKVDSSAIRIESSTDVDKKEGGERGKELTSDQKEDLINKGMSPGLVNECRLDKDIYVLKTQNDNLVNTRCPASDVQYIKKIIDLQGIKVEGVFAKFDAIFSAKLPAEKYLASDKVQFEYCNQQLKNEIKVNPSLKELFSERQLEQISVGQKPSGFTWNHNEEMGKMELVDTAKHSATPHTGGKAVWGGGSAYR